MTRRGPAAPAGAAEADGRLANARAHLAAAEDQLALLEPGLNANPVRSLAVLAAIAYADALTARFGGVLNRKDHAALPATLRAALGNQLPAARARDLAAILDAKDEVHYGVGIGRRDEAEKAMERLRRFSEWVEDLLAGRPR